MQLIVTLVRASVILRNVLTSLNAQIDIAYISTLVCICAACGERISAKNRVVVNNCSHKYRRAQSRTISRAEKQECDINNYALEAHHLLDKDKRAYTNDIMA